MYRYNIDNKLITSPIPLPGETHINLTNEEAKFCIGFDVNGNAIYDQAAIEAENQRLKNIQIEEIKTEYLEKQKQGVSYNGNLYQYDLDSWSLLESVVSDSRVNFWRSVDNNNITLTNLEKSELLEILKVKYFTEFVESRNLIDNL
jgi:hypothetical protein